MRMRTAILVLLAALVVVAAGCGASAGSDAESGASILRPGALVYWETVSDPDSEQWQQAEELIKKFPDGDKWIAMLRREIEQETKVTWAEIRDALGDETVVAVYAPTANADPSFVVLLNPEDTEKSLDVIRRLNASQSEPADRVVTRVIDPWIVLGETQAAIDSAVVGEGARALGDEEAFKSGLAALPGDALSRLYVDVALAVERFAPQLGAEDRDAFRMFGLDKIDFAGVWANAEDRGAKIAAVVRGSSLEGLFGTNEPFSSELLERVPDDAFAFFTFRGEAATRQLEKLESNALYRMVAREIERYLGVELQELIRLFEGEVAFYARPASPIPELTLLLDEADPEQARQSAENVLRALAERSEAEVTEDGGVTTARFDGFSLSVGALEGLVVLTTSRQAISDLAADGTKLPDSARFKDALDAADAPDAYTGLAYVDLVQTIKVVMGFVDSSGENVPPDISRNLEPLRSFVAFGTSESGSASFQAFLEID